MPEESVREISALECDFIQITRLWDNTQKGALNLLLGNEQKIDGIVIQMIENNELELTQEEHDFLIQYYFENKSMDDIVAGYEAKSGKKRTPIEKREFEYSMRSILARKIFDNNSFKDRLIIQLLGKSKEEITKEALINNPNARDLLRQYTDDEDFAIKCLYSEENKQLKGRNRLEIIKMLRKSSKLFDATRSLLCLKYSERIIPYKSSRHAVDKVPNKEEEWLEDKPWENKRPSIKIGVAVEAARSLKQTWEMFKTNIVEGIRQFFELDDDTER